jgi:L-fucose isomerase-like protein
MVIPEITLGVIVGTRGFFNPELSKSDKDKLIAVLDSLGIDYLIPPADLTPTGCIEGHEDAVKAGAWFRERRDRLDGMLILLPNFGDEVGIVETLKSIDKDLPLLVQASEDEPDKVSVSQRRGRVLRQALGLQQPVSAADPVYRHLSPHGESGFP